ncbi:hypothetical protein [Rhizobium sp. Root483D2]|uniref:ribbon-helix-helix domain-containing protein n=1 Tax=Rhizobium sp. Root483D2 TaxID=1736545 RepID=UPI000712BD20|nr:hypothetical protein [Rhizobium sp. Root483D2]KQY31907.1 hypothetical protein ASD32_04805 [Rhizobium sp. Root483D2]
MNEKLSITLPAELVEIINDRVDAGLYASSSDVLEAAMVSIRARVKASLDDPRPNISSDDMDRWINQKYRVSPL